MYALHDGTKWSRPMSIPSSNSRFPTVANSTVCFDREGSSLAREIACIEDIASITNEVAIPNDGQCAEYVRPRFDESGRFLVFTAKDCSYLSPGMVAVLLFDRDTSKTYLVDSHTMVGEEYDGIYYKAQPRACYDISNGMIAVAATCAMPGRYVSPVYYMIDYSQL